MVVTWWLVAFLTSEGTYHHSAALVTQHDGSAAWQVVTTLHVRMPPLLLQHILSLHCYTVLHINQLDSLLSKGYLVMFQSVFTSRSTG